MKTTKNTMKNCYIDNWWFWIRKTNALLKLINRHDDIGKIYLHAKDLIEPKYEFLI